MESDSRSKVLERPSLTLKRKPEELAIATLCDGTTIEEDFNDLDLWADNLDDLLGFDEPIGIEGSSSQLIDCAGLELDQLPQESMLTDTLESKEEKESEDTVISIEGAKSTDKRDTTSNCNSPLWSIEEDFWKKPMFEVFGEGKTMLTDANRQWQAYEYRGFPRSVRIGNSSTNVDSGNNDQWWKLSTAIEDYCTVFNSVGDESWIDKHVSSRGLNQWPNNGMRKIRRTGLGEHQSCATAVRTSTTPNQSRKGHAVPSGFKASSLVSDEQSMGVAQASPPKE